MVLALYSVFMKSMTTALVVAGAAIVARVSLAVVTALVETFKNQPVVEVDRASATETVYSGSIVVHVKP